MATACYLVPDYYPDFRCKISACRESCCSGWQVTVSLSEYYRLLGADCPKKLRQLLDRGLRVVDNPRDERYAAIEKNYEGDCLLHGADGRCMLQDCCGEKALSAVCRLYPRAPRSKYGLEASMSASCERVAELLMQRDEKLSFIEHNTDFDIQLPKPRDCFAAGIYRPMRAALMSLLQRREYPLADRLCAVAELCAALDPALGAEDGQGIMKLISAETKIPRAETSGTNGLKTALALLSRFSDSRCAGESFAAAVERYEGADGEKMYAQDRERFAAEFPRWEVMFEQVLVNHVFYDGFPFAETLNSAADNALALCALYALWRVAAVSNAAVHKGFDALVDLTAAAFRMLEHSGFNAVSVALVKRSGGAGGLASL